MLRRLVALVTLEAWAHHITVVPSRKEITFIDGDEVVRIPPFLWVSDGRVTGVGQAPESTAPSDRIDLLEGNDKADHLIKFFAHAMERVHGRSVWVRPILTFRLDGDDPDPERERYWTEVAHGAKALRVEFEYRPAARGR